MIVDGLFGLEAPLTPENSPIHPQKISLERLILRHSGIPGQFCRHGYPTPNVKIQKNYGNF